MRILKRFYSTPIGNYHIFNVSPLINIKTKEILPETKESNIISKNYNSYRYMYHALKAKNKLLKN